jgi:glycosyltransferase involved in cell wall biosynthesis
MKNTPLSTNVNDQKWIMGTPFRVDYYNQFATALQDAGKLRMSFLWHRSGFPNIPHEKTRLFPTLGKVAYATARYGNSRVAEKIRFGMYPIYDRWMSTQISHGDCIYSSYGYANASFKKIKSLGGKTILDGGNSHPINFWKILSVEKEIWGSKEDPIAKFQYERSLDMMEFTDYVISPSTFVTNSFVEQGFPREKIISSFYPVNLGLFTPSLNPRPHTRPFTIANTSTPMLRKGAPYLFEAFRIIKKQIPNARFLVTLSGHLDPVMEKIIASYSDLDIDWAGYLSESDLADRLRSADILIQPSLEEGLVRTALQAIACGLPVILTPNTGANDYVQEGVNGSVVPIRDAVSIAEQAFYWWEKIQNGYQTPVSDIQNRLRPEAYRSRVVEMVNQIESDNQ